MPNITFSRVVRLIVLDAGPINTLAAAHRLSLLLSPPQIRLTLLRSVVDEILVRSDDLAAFMATHSDRIDVIETSVCRDNAARRRRGEVLGKGRVDLAIADFLLNEIDRVTGEAPSLLITEDRKLLERLSSEAFRNVRFMTPVAYLRALERKGVDSFPDVWRAIVEDG